MRSGLHKPGTVPLLALILFCLLTLVPTLAKEWGLNGLGSGWPLYGYGAQLAYLGLPLPRYDGNGRYFSSRVKNASVETRPRRHLTGENCKPSFFGDLYSSCFENNAQRHPQQQQPHYSAVRTPPSSFEAAAEPGKDQITRSATKEPSTLTRGMSAFKEFVIKRWDDQQTIGTLSRHDSDETAWPTPTDASSATTALAEQQRLSMPADDITPDGIANSESLISRLPLLVYDAWQQACHAGGQFFATLTAHSPTYRYLETLIPRHPAPASTPGVLQPEKQRHDKHPSGEPSLNSSSAQDLAALELSDSIPIPILPPNTSDATAGQSKHPGFRRDSEQMCGSSMAIVIALVAGIIWF